MSKEIVPIQPQTPGLSAARFREATDVAGVCRDIVTKTAVEIQKRKYVQVEGWTSIAVAHGFIASIKPDSVREIQNHDGVITAIVAVAQLKRQADNVVLAEAEGYVGDDEEDWFGSHGEPVMRWSKYLNKEVEKVIPPRPFYAIRSMAQTRAVAKVCKLAFSYIVVLIDTGLSTTPAEEIRGLDLDEEPGRESTTKGATTTNTASQREAQQTNDEPPKPPVSVPRDEGIDLGKQFRDNVWKEVRIHFGNTNGPKNGKPGKKLGELERGSLAWYAFKWSGPRTGSPSEEDRILRAALSVAIEEENLQPPAER